MNRSCDIVKVIERVARPAIRDRGALMSVEPASAGDAIPPKCEVIEVRVAELRQLFNAIDPSPFRERDLDPRAEEFIVDWSRDLPSDAPLALVVHLGRAAGRPDEAVILREAIHEFFDQRAASSRRNLRQLFRRGRISWRSAWRSSPRQLRSGTHSPRTSGSRGPKFSGKACSSEAGWRSGRPLEVSVRLMPHAKMSTWKICESGKANAAFVQHMTPVEPIAGLVNAFIYGTTVETSSRL